MSTNQGFQSLICNEENDNLFLFYALKFHKRKFLRLSQGATFLEIGKNAIKQVSMPLPILKEQQKIAPILSGIDAIRNSFLPTKSRTRLAMFLMFLRAVIL